MNNAVNSLSLPMVSPKDITWQEKKLLSETISQLYRETQYETYSHRLDSCANYLAFRQWVNNDTGEYKLKLNRVFLCKVRHCPCCAWSRSRVWKRRLHEGIPKLVADHSKTRFIFLTLTVPNCHISDLRKTLDGMSNAFHKLMKRRGIKKTVLGYVRSMEVTRNPETGYAHPHFHVLLAVKPTYFGNDYISQDAWVNHWKECLNTSENRIVDVRAVKPKTNSKSDPLGINNAVMEVAKYCVKHTDMIVEKDWLIQMTTQLNATKHVVLGGLIKQYVNYKEPNEEDILKGDDDDTEGLDEHDLLFFYWNKYRKNYYLCNR